MNRTKRASRRQSRAATIVESDGELEAEDDDSLLDSQKNNRHSKITNEQEDILITAILKWYDSIG